MASGRDTPARWLADGSCPQHVQHRAQGHGVHAHANAQSLTGLQHQFQYRLRAALLPPRAPFHQSEPHWPCLLKAFTPSVEGVLRQASFLAELLHGNSAVLLRSDSFGPLVCFRVGRLRVHDSVAHDTRMQRPPAQRKSGSRDAYVYRAASAARLPATWLRPSQRDPLMAGYPPG